MNIPEDVTKILEKLNNENYEAYIVGGCVRDSILGKEPHDWDITTNATPEDVCRVFNEYHILPTGLKHGTVTIMMNGIGYEVTTYRTESGYSDHRHPDEVKFTTSLIEDLSRRDFTINAMAMDKDGNIIDPFGGQEDIKHKFIHCVGEPENRFREDALRILRAIRFAVQLGFNIHIATSCAMEDMYTDLKYVSQERITSEFSKIICANGKQNAITLGYACDYIFDYIIPELTVCRGFKQNNPNHDKDVYDHIMSVLFALMNAEDYYSGSLVVRLAALLHDIGKPACYTEKDGIGHFYGHGDESERIAREILRRMKYSNYTIDRVCLLVKYHDYPIEPTRKCVRKLINKVGKDNIDALCSLRFADIMAQSDYHKSEKLDNLSRFIDVKNSISKDEQIFSLRDLEINGNDIINITGKQGKIVGEILNDILNKVMSDELTNKKEFLLEYVTQYIDDK